MVGPVVLRPREYRHLALCDGSVQKVARAGLNEILDKGNDNRSMHGLFPRPPL